MSCWLVPSVIVGLAVMITALGDALLTANVEVDAFTDPYIAEILVVPVARPAATPAFVPKSWIVTAVGLEELHCTRFVTSCCVLSPNVALALKGRVVPGAMLAVPGEIVTDLMVTAFTCSVGLVPLTPPSVAVTVALP